MADKRDTKGRFAEGNSGGPGRPKRATETAYMSVVMQECDFDAWREIVAKAVQDAQAGDRYARQWLTTYLLGEPSPRHFAPRPSRVIALEEMGEDGTEDEMSRIKLDRITRGFA